MIQTLLAGLYERLRGRTLESDVPPAVLIEFSTRKALAALIGLVHSRRYKEGHLLHFRDRHVSVLYAQNLRVGRAVAFASGVIVDCHSRHGIVLGDGVTVGRGTSIRGSGVIANTGQGVKIGSKSAVGSNNTIWGQGGVEIGRNCLLGPNVTLISENHRFDAVDTPIKDQGEIRGRISIGDDCWLATGVVVTAGVSIGDGVVVGAGAVVTRDLPSYSIAVGVPAKVTGSRL